MYCNNDLAKSLQLLDVLIESIDPLKFVENLIKFVYFKNKPVCAIEMTKMNKD